MNFIKKFFPLIFLIWPCAAFSQANISTTQAIDQIEKTLMSNDYKGSSGRNSSVRINKVPKKNADSPKIEMVIIDSKNNDKIQEKQKLAYAAGLVNQYEVAIELYKQILKAEPNNNYAKFGLATSYHKLGEYRKAKIFYYQLLKTDPQNKEEIIGNLLEVIVEESPNDAIYMLSRLSAQNPNSSYILARSAMAYDKINRSDQAILLLTRAIALEPKAEYKFNLAVIYDKMKDYPNAAALYQQVIKSYNESDEIDEQNIPILEIKKRLEFIKKEI